MITHACNEQGPTFYLNHVSYPLLLHISSAEIVNDISFLCYIMNTTALLLMYINKLIILVYFPYQTTFFKNHNYFCHNSPAHEVAFISCNILTLFSPIFYVYAALVRFSFLLVAYYTNVHVQIEYFPHACTMPRLQA